MLKRDYIIRDIHKDELYNLAEFVVNQNYDHHSANASMACKRKEIEILFNEERMFFHDSCYTVAFDRDHEIVGSIRTMQWGGQGSLPIEKVFNINISDFTTRETQASIWHIGRLAVKRGHSNIELFKTMILSAIEPICQDINSVAFAECDVKLMRTLKRMGINTEVIAEPVVYLSSTTAPVRMSGKTLSNFYFQNYRPAQSASKNVVKMLM